MGAEDQLAAGGPKMDLASKVAELDKVSAVVVSELRHHKEHDSERFDQFVQTAKDINAKMDQLMTRVDKGVTRAHERIDEQVAARKDLFDKSNAEFSKLKSDVQRQNFQTRIWVLTGALTVTIAMAWYFFTDRMEDVKRATTTPAALVSGVKAGELPQQN